MIITWRAYLIEMIHLHIQLSLDILQLEEFKLEFGQGL